MTLLSPGTVFAERFTVGRLVDDGPRGQVYAARSEPDQQACRLRVLPADTPIDEPARARFAELMASLPAHEAFPAVVASGVTEEGLAFAATPWSEGSSLEDVVRARGRLPRPEARVLVAEIAAALGALHATGQGHDALSPDLIMLSPVTGAGSRLRPTLLDAGILRFQIERGGGVPYLLALSPLSGWSPHVRILRSARPDGRKNDVVSFAHLVHLVLVGRSYWKTVVTDEESHVALLKEIGRGLTEPASQRAGSGVWLPEGFDIWFGRCFSSEPDRATLASVAADLAALFDAPDPPSPAELAAEAKKRAGEASAWAAASAAHAAPARSREEEEKDEIDWAELVAEAGGAGLVSLHLPGTTATAGGVVFELPSWVSVFGAESIANAMVATARALEGQPRVGGGGIGGAIARLFGRGGQRRYQRILDDLGIGPPARHDPNRSPFLTALLPIPGPVCAGLDAEGLTLEYRCEAWVRSHERGWVSRPYARVPKAALPVAAEAFAAMVQAAAGAAASYDTSQEARSCSLCARVLPAIEMHDRTTCHACAEQHLHVIY